MATSRIGLFCTERASPTAPVPRPPQPTSARRIVLSSPAWTEGTARPAKAEAAVILPASARKWRRVVVGLGSVTMLLLGTGRGSGGIARGVKQSGMPPGGAGAIERI